MELKLRPMIVITPEMHCLRKDVDMPKSSSALLDLRQVLYDTYLTSSLRSKQSSSSYRADALHAVCHLKK